MKRFALALILLATGATIIFFASLGYWRAFYPDETGRIACVAGAVLILVLLALFIAFAALGAPDDGHD